MSGERFDAVIAGGGLSGLSLAAHLAALGWQDRSVLVVDPEVPAGGAVCWGSWTSRRGLLDAAVSRGYRQVRIQTAGQSTVVRLPPYRYQLVHRVDLKRAVTEILDGCTDFEIRRGRVDSIRDGSDDVTVVVDGAPTRAAWVFDSRPVPADTTPPDARLAFTGWEIRTRCPVFDPDTPILFDFRIPQERRCRFVYVLPASPYQALVELTEFVPRRARPTTAPARLAALAGYLHEVAGATDYEILRTEGAVIPLRVRPPRRSTGRVLAIGARAGLIKASTGYGYQRIQRDSEAVARSLVRYGHPFALPGTRRRHRMLDALLLDVFDHDPTQLEQAFASLFTGNPAGRVLRFLDEDTGVPDELRLIASMPHLPYLRGIARML
jgi:lycopene beta-cyclase